MMPSNSILYFCPSCKSIHHIERISQAIQAGPENKVIALLENSCRDSYTLKNETGKTALHMAASSGRYAVIQWLLAKKVKVDEKDTESGYTALHRASIEGNFHIMKLLIEKNANESLVDNECMTPFDHLCMDQDLLQFFNQQCLQKHAFAWGSNNNFTLGMVKAAPVAECLESLSTAAHGFTQISTNKYHTLMLSGKGVVYACGVGHKGRLGLKHEKQVIIPMPIKMFRYSVKMVAAGEDHSLFLMGDSAEVYACGCNAFGQLGCGAQCKSTLAMVKVRFAPNTVLEFEGVAAAKYHSVIWSADVIYTFGLNGGQLGHRKDAQQTIPYPKEVTSIYSKNIGDRYIKSVAVSVATTAIAFMNGSIVLLHDYHNGVISSGCPEIKKVLSVGGRLDIKVDNNFKDSSAVVVILTQTGHLYIWTSDQPRLVPCFTSPIKGIKVTDFCLHENGCSIISTLNQGFDGLFQPGPPNNFQTLLLKRIPHMFSATNIFCDPKGASFFALQPQPEQLVRLRNVLDDAVSWTNRGLLRFRPRKKAMPNRPILCTQALLQCFDSTPLSELSPLCNHRITVLDDMSCDRSGENDSRDSSDPLVYIPQDPVRKDGVADVWFLCEDEVVVAANKALLGSKSTYFNMMFSSSWKEATQKDPIVSKATSPLFSLIVEYLTAEKPQLPKRLSFSDLCEIAITADYYLATALLSDCADQLSSLICLKNSTDMLAMAQKYSWKSLKQTAVTFITSNLLSQYQNGLLSKLDARSLRMLSDHYKGSLYQLEPTFKTEHSRPCNYVYHNTRKVHTSEGTQQSLDELLLAFHDNPYTRRCQTKMHLEKGKQESKAKRTTAKKQRTTSQRSNDGERFAQEVPTSSSSKKETKLRSEWISVGKSVDKPKKPIKVSSSSPVANDGGDWPLPNAAEEKKPQQATLCGRLTTIDHKDMQPQNDRRLSAEMETPEMSDCSIFPTLNEVCSSKPSTRDAKLPLPIIDDEPVKNVGQLTSNWANSPPDSAVGPTKMPVSFMEILEIEEKAVIQNEINLNRTLTSVQTEERALSELLQFYGGPWNPDENIFVVRVKPTNAKTAWVKNRL